LFKKIKQEIMAKKLIRILFVVLLMASPMFISKSLAVGMGMGGGMGPPAPCGGPFPPCPIPLDNGILLLLCAGLLYGGKKIFDSFILYPV